MMIKLPVLKFAMLFRLATHNYSFSSYDDLVDVLKYVLPQDDIVRDMSLASKKCSYSLAYGLGPYYHLQLVEDVRREYFSLIIDETTTQQNKKQLDLLVKYWSAQTHRIQTRYLTSCFLGHATADVMNNSVLSVLSADGWSLQKMVMLSSDGPNVNISLKRKLDEEIKAVGGQSLVDIGSCTLHTVHNALHKGLTAVPHWGIDEFVTDVYYWFKNYPSRQEDFLSVRSAITDDEISSTFKRFVDNRWLSLGPVIDRLLQNFDRLCEFFLKGKFDSATSNSSRFKRICIHLRTRKVTTVRLLFIRNICCDYERFLTLYQKSSPMIHQLHGDLTELLRQFLRRFVKPELIQEREVNDLVQFVTKLSNEHYMPKDKLNIGSEATKIMRELKADNNQYSSWKALNMDIINFFEKSAAYLVKKLPLTNILLKNLACFDPLCRRQATTVQMILAVVSQLPYYNNAQMKDEVLREWQRYQEDSEITEELYICGRSWGDDGTCAVMYCNVDEYWHKVMMLTDSRGQPKYPALAQVVKMVLSLSHGQSDVERGFSINKRILNDRTALSEKSICALRTVKEVIALYNGTIENIPISSELFRAYRSAHRLYKEERSKEKAKKLEIAVLGKRKAATSNVDTFLQELHAMKSAMEEKQKNAEKLISEGTDRLTAALDDGKGQDILPARALLESGNKLLKECRQELESISKKIAGHSGQHQAISLQSNHVLKESSLFWGL